MRASLVEQKLAARTAELLTDALTSPLPTSTHFIQTSSTLFNFITIIIISMSVTIFVIAACQKICVARGAAPRPTTPTHFVPRPYPGSCPFLSPIVQLWGPTGHLVEIFLNPGYVASPTNGYPPAPHPAHSPGSALPYHQVSTPPYHCNTMLCHTIPDRTIPQCHQVSTCTPISHFSCLGLPSACSSTSSCFSFKGRAWKLFCNPSSLLEDD